MKYAPIALFVYKRPWHLQRTLQSLKSNSLAEYSDLVIYSDAPKDLSCEKEVLAIRKWIRKISGFNRIRIVEREHNLGLANSIIQGVTALVNEFSKVIVLEDDMVLSPHFLQYMNDALALYQDDESVASIHGYAFPIGETMPETYFLQGADCWGWATWRRAWQKFEPDGKKLLMLLEQKKLNKAFNFNDTQPNVQMLKDQVAGKNNSWAIRWHASAFIHEMLTLYPGRSLVRNIGTDNSGEHCVQSSILDGEIADERIMVERIPLFQNKEALAACIRYFKRHRRSLFTKILQKISPLRFKAQGQSC